MGEIGRRTFLQAGSVGLAAAPAVLSQDNKVLRVAVIGVGNRGTFLMKEFQRLSGVRIDVVCDIYEGHLTRAKEFSVNTKVRL